MEAHDEVDDMPPIPLMQCPQCGAVMEDLDGFGVLAHNTCGFCTHPCITDDACDICGARA